MLNWQSEFEQIVTKMVDESGNPAGFDVSAWLTTWMNTPVPALNGEKPIALVKTPTGVEQVKHVLQCMQSGSYC